MLQKSEFKLYPGPEVSSLRFKDYFILMTLAKGVKRLLEIGPGISTLAFVEAGVPEIVTLEHNKEWFDKSVEMLKDYPQVKISHYEDVVPIATSGLAPEEKFDLAFVDSPKGYDYQIQHDAGRRKIHPGYEAYSRLNTCLLALQHAPHVILHDAYRSVERGTLGQLHKMGHTYSYIMTDNEAANPHSGMAYITRG